MLQNFLQQQQHSSQQRTENNTESQQQQQQLDEFIIDEILSLEGEQQQQANNRQNNYICPTSIQQQQSSRPIPLSTACSRDSSNASIQSGSPGFQTASGGFALYSPKNDNDFRQIISSSAPTSCEIEYVPELENQNILLLNNNQNNYSMEYIKNKEKEKNEIVEDDEEEEEEFVDEWENGEKEEKGENNFVKIENKQKILENNSFLNGQKSVLKRKNSFVGVCGERKRGIKKEQKLREIVLRNFIRRGVSGVSTSGPDAVNGRGSQHSQAINRDLNMTEVEIYKDRRKKDIHNMIERRRRYNINDRIKELGLMLPKSTAEEMKLNKGTILKASCDYIRQLQKDREIMIRHQQKTTKLEELAKQYFQRIQDLENQLEKNGINIPPCKLPAPNALSPPICLPSSTQHGKCIKQEPSEELIGSFSPSSTPQAKIACSLQEMQIASPTSSHASLLKMSNIQQQFGHSPFIIGSAPTDMANYLNQHVLNNSTNNSLNILQQQQQPMEFGSNWNTQSQLGQIFNTGNYGELNMEEFAFQHNRGPLQGQDPLMSQHGGSLSNQLSPVIQWDQSSFSPGHEANH
uniref:BHLH domain-containing protein n=1 Tax=Meloidogyne hapla TaxID=6305 RepID=A0A1I8BLI2_MELHA